MRCLKILILALTGVLVSVACYAATSVPQAKAIDEVAIARLKLDTEQAAFNRRLELEKLDVERMKAWITGGSLMVPLMVAAITFALGVRNQNQQARLQREAQEATERAQFELKAAEVVLDVKGPVAAKNKARALKALFPKRLPDDFVTSFNPSDFEGPKRESYEAKVAFFEVAASHAKDISSVATLWKQLFPGDKWTERLNGEPETPSEPAVKAQPIVAGDAPPIGGAPPELAR